MIYLNLILNKKIDKINIAINKNIKNKILI